MNKSFIFVFFYNLLICFIVSSSYFYFDKVIIDFIKSLNVKIHLRIFDQPLRYLNWIVPFLVPILMNYIRPFRFSLHQALMFNFICLFFIKTSFFVLELVNLTDNSINLNIILPKIWLLQIIYSFVLSIIYWINYISLVSHFKKNEILLINTCYLLTTIFGNHGNFNYQLTFKSFFITYELATVLLLIIYYIFCRFNIEIKGNLF